MSVRLDVSVDARDVKRLAELKGKATMAGANSAEMNPVCRMEVSVRGVVGARFGGHL